MRWQQVARIAIAAAGLGTAATIYFSTRSRPAPSRPPATTAPTDPGTTMRAGKGTDMRYKGDALVWKLDYDSTSSYNDGRIVRQGVHVHFAEDGTDVWAGQAEMKGKAASGDEPAELALSDHVRLEGSDHATMEGDTAAYSDTTKTATVPGAVTFSRGKMIGHGTGGTFQRDTGVFKILADADVTITPDDGSGAIDATAQSMTYTRDDKTMSFEGQAHIGRQAETMTADHAVLHLSDDEQEFKLIELRTGAHVAPAPGKTSNLPEMQADDIDLAFYPGGQALQHAVLMRQASMVMSDANGKRSIAATTIDFDAAPDGKTLTRLNGADHVVVKTAGTSTAPPRTILAPALAATGDDKNGLTSAVFTGGAEFDENVPASQGHPASTRTGKSAVLTLKIQGQLDAIDEAHFQQGVTFKDGDVTGDADLATYFASKNRLDLLPLPTKARRPPHVTDGSMTVDAADLITVYLDTSSLDAAGKVSTASKGDASSTDAKDTNSVLFNSHDLVVGSGATFSYDAAAKTTRYTAAPEGPLARVHQDDTEVRGMDILLNTDTQDLTATGKVHSDMLVADTLDDASGSGGGSAAGSSSGAKSAVAAPAPAKASASDGTTTPLAPTTKMYHADADSLVYKDAARTATYTGKPGVDGAPGTRAVLKSVSSETDGDTITLTIKADSRTLDRLDAQSHVYFKLAEVGREGRGDSLVYETDANRYTLNGTPLSLKSKDTDGSCSLSTGTRVIFYQDMRAAEWPERPGGFSNKSPQKVACSAPLPQ